MPFEEAVLEPRAPHRDLPLLLIAVEEHLKLHALPDPRLLRDRVILLHLHCNFTATSLSHGVRLSEQGFGPKLKQHLN